MSSSVQLHSQISSGDHHRIQRSTETVASPSLTFFSLQIRRFEGILSCSYVFKVNATLNVIRMFTNTSVTSSSRKSSKHRSFVRFAVNCCGRWDVNERDGCAETFVSTRGFAYKGFQCQRCDCVIHKECYDRCVHPCNGKKYDQVSASSLSLCLSARLTGGSSEDRHE